MPPHFRQSGKVIVADEGFASFFGSEKCRRFQTVIVTEGVRRRCFTPPIPSPSLVEQFRDTFVRTLALS